MILRLAGLAIERVDGEAPPRGTRADVVWRVVRDDALGAAASASFVHSVTGTPDDAGQRTTFLFGYGGRINCLFEVDAQGREIVTRARSSVTDRDLMSLLGEYILRTVLIRRECTSFHAAGLASGGRSILVMGDKGAGKSTLSGALQKGGWTLLADDLTRVELAGGGWLAHAGSRQTKLLRASLEALGLDADALPPRWDDPGPEAEWAGGNKLLLDPPAPVPPGCSAVPLAALLLLGKRAAGAQAVTARRLHGAAAVAALLAHATPDPLAPGRLPAAIQREMGALVREVPILALTLPDSLARLDAAAGEIAALIPALQVPMPA